MVKQALVVTEELVCKMIDIADNELQALQTAVDGLIQPVDVTPNVTMWVNEEGLFRGDLGMNPMGTAIMRELYDNSDAWVVGDIVFTGAPDSEGRTTGLEQSDIDTVAGIIGFARELMARN